MNSSTSQSIQAEEDLAHAARAGSSAAFCRLVAPYVNRLLRYLSHKTVTVHDAEDLVQETLMRAFQNMHRFQPQRAFASWLFTIATRLAVSHYRARRGAFDVDSMWLADRKAVNPHDAVARREQHDNLWTLAQHVLSRDQFDALWLRYSEDMPVRDISRALGKTQIHVKVILHRARRKMLEANPAGLTQPSEGRQELPMQPRGETCGAK